MHAIDSIVAAELEALLGSEVRAGEYSLSGDVHGMCAPRWELRRKELSVKTQELLKEERLGTANFSCMLRNPLFASLSHTAQEGGWQGLCHGGYWDHGPDQKGAGCRQRSDGSTRDLIRSFE